MRCSREGGGEEEKRPSTGPKGLPTFRGQVKDEELAQDTEEGTVSEIQGKYEISVQDEKQEECFKERQMLVTCC